MDLRTSTRAMRPSLRQRRAAKSAQRGKPAAIAASRATRPVISRAAALVMAEKVHPGARGDDQLLSDDGNLKAAEVVTRIAVAWLRNPRNKIPAATVPELLRRIHEGLASR